MSSGQKAAFSFLSALILFAGFVFFAHTGLMAQIETKFYAQAKIGEKKEQLDKLAKGCNSYISDILAKIQTGNDAYLKASAVKTYAHQTPSEKDATDRKNLTAQLFDELDSYGFEGMRLIEKNGRTLHYSSYETDVLKRVSLSTTYKLYTDVVKDSDELESDVLLVNADKPETKILLDAEGNRIIFAFPFYITDNTFFATLVCYCNITAFEQNFLNDGSLNAGDSLIPVAAQNSYEGGFVKGLPSDSRKEFYTPVLEAWKKSPKAQEQNFQRILEKDDGSYWLLMTSSQSSQFKISAVYSSTLFELPKEMEYLIYICVFMTLLLASSLIFNIKRDYLTIIKTRIKKVQFGIINEYLENKEKIEWSQIARQLENRKAELSEEIKKAVGGKSKKYSKQVDAYLDSSWEDIIGILKAQNGGESSGIGGATIEEIRSVIEDVLRTSRLNVNVAGVTATPVLRQAQEPQEVEDIEEVEALDEAEPVEEIEEAEPVEEIEEAEEAEEVEDIEEAEPVEEIEEAEEVEDIEEAEPVEEIEEVEEVEEAEPVEDIEEVEEIEEAEPVEEIEEAGVPELVEGPEEVEEIEEAEPVEEIEELEEVEELKDMFIPAPPPQLPEDLFIGEPKDSIINAGTVSQGFVFEISVPHFFEEETVEEIIEESEPAEDVEPIEAIEDAEILEEPAYFSMTRFAQHEEPVIELKGDGDFSTSNQDEQTIVEKNGLYSISENLPYTKVLLNKEFKALVDSVLQN